MPTEIVKRVVWPIVVASIIFLMLTVTPFAAKLYVDKRHITVLGKIDLLNYKVDLILKKLRVEYPEDR